MSGEWPAEEETGGGPPALIDAVVVVCVLALAFAVTTLDPASPTRVVVTLSTLLLVPGYVLTLALFPAEPGEAERSRSRLTVSPAKGAQTAALDVFERAALSFGLSVVSLPLFAMFLAASDLPTDAGTILTVVTGFAIPVLLVGLLRRARTPASSRYAPSTTTFGAALDRLTRRSTFDAGLNVVLVLVTVGAVASLGFALASPQDGPGYTQVNLLTEDPSGNLSASDYPTNLTRNETGEVVLSVTNQEHERTEYTVVVQRQEVGPDGAVTERSELDRFEVDTEAGTTIRVRHEFQVDRIGQDQRIAYLLYRDQAPSEPTLDSAYRNVYFWMDVWPVGGDAGTNTTVTST